MTRLFGGGSTILTFSSFCFNGGPHNNLCVDRVDIVGRVLSWWAIACNCWIHAFNEGERGGGSEYWWGVLTLFAAINWPLVALTIQQFSGPPPLNIFPCIMFDAVWKEFFRLSLSLSLLCCDYWGEKGVHRVACPVGRPGIQTTDQGNKVLYPG